VKHHTAFINWRQQINQHKPPSQTPIKPLHMPVQRLKMPQNLSVKAKRICDIIGMYGTVDFADALGNFIAEVLNSTLPGRTTWYYDENVYLPFS